MRDIRKFFRFLLDLFFNKYSDPLRDKYSYLYGIIKLSDSGMILGVSERAFKNHNAILKRIVKALKINHSWYRCKHLWRKHYRLGTPLDITINNNVANTVSTITKVKFINAIPYFTLWQEDLYFTNELQRAKIDQLLTGDMY